MKTTSYEVYGELKGFIWYPQVECTKEFNKTFIKENDKKLYHVLQSVVSDGDFQDAKIDWAYLIVKKEYYKKMTNKDGSHYWQRYKTVTRERWLKGISEPDLFYKVA